MTFHAIGLFAAGGDAVFCFLFLLSRSWGLALLAAFGAVCGVLGWVAA